MKSTYQEIEQETETLKKALIQFPDGATLDQLRAVSGLQLELRTLQRRLARLAEMSELRTSGGKRSTRYYPVAETRELIVADDGTKYYTTRDANQIQLSVSCQQILASILQPVNQRKAVGYNRKILESYRPNIDSYLTTTEKKKLSDIGRTSRSDQPAGTYAREILNRLLIDLSWNSSRLEGNTYTLLDTERLVEFGDVAENRSVLEAQMIINHKEAIEFLVQPSDDIGFNKYTILNLHALLSNNLLPDPAASGRLRSLAVGVSTSSFTPLLIPQQIEVMFRMILDKVQQIENPFEQAFFLMVHIPYLHPFDDVNERVSRLVSNLPLNSHNLSPLTFVDVPNELYRQSMLAIYEQNRVEPLKELFLWAYERSSFRYSAKPQTLGEPDPFKMKYRKTIRTLITEIISNALGHKAASKLIDERSQTLPDADHTQFITVVASELLALHEGNFARYFVSPGEFTKWKKEWDR